jgi:3-dehydroquinate dehydratase / shikimate dehydrogenase
MMHPLLRTPRLILRPWQDEDLEAFASLNADPKVMEFFPAMLSREESDNLAGRIQKEFLEKQYGLWAVEAPGMSRFIGFIGLHFQNFKAHFTPCVEIGWRLASPFWGKGYATEWSRAALQYGFEKESGCKRIRARTLNTLLFRKDILCACMYCTVSAEKNG